MNVFVVASFEWERWKGRV